MGLQDEYLRNFTVLLTEKGVVPLTDPMQMSVYDCLLTGTKRPSDIAAELGVPSSTLHFVLDKMVDSGIIVKSKPDPEKKSVYYSNLAVKILASSTPGDSAVRESDAVFSDPARYYSGLSAVANMMECYANEIGLDLGRIRAKYARDLADVCFDSSGSDSVESCITTIREEFARVTSFKFSIYGLNPLALIIEGDRCMSSKMDMLQAFISRALEISTGKSYAVTATEDFSSGDIARYKVSFDRVERPEDPYFNTSLPKTAASRFMIVDLDGSVGLMTSDVQIDMIDAIYERPLCITDIVNCVDAPRSTITSNLLRMVEEGIITVFYSESGSAYYGLSCSILMKKSRDSASADGNLERILWDAAGKDGGLMEGYMLYAISYLKSMGFDTDYIMVVLGAKYMRAAGRDDPKNFDIFFGRMSEIADTVGLSMNIVSIYPLTIGITVDDPESGVATAMTFVKGMAHQGLEMASDGIFVRNMEGTEVDKKISFKEIYPALSMTPVDGVKVENLSTAASVKKRTSSVKTALFNRSMKEVGKPAKTVRHITGIAIAMLTVAVLVFSMTGDPGSVADTYTIDIDDSCTDLVFYDEYGAEIPAPDAVSINSTITFAPTDASMTLGYVQNGLAYKLSPDDAGIYTMTVTSDFRLERLQQVTPIFGAKLGIYNFDEDVTDKYASLFPGYYTSSDYAKATGGLWVGSNAAIRLTANSDGYISFTDGKSDSILWKQQVVKDASLSGISIKRLPSAYVSVEFNGDYYHNGNYLTGEVSVAKGKTLNLTFASARSSGTTILVTSPDSDATRTIAVNDDDNTFRLAHCVKDMKVDYRLGDFS